MREKQRKLLIDLRSSLIAEQKTLPYCIYPDATIEALLDAQKNLKNSGKNQLSWAGVECWIN